MPRCKNLVSQYVPQGYGYKEVKLPCGSTSIHGTELICEECEAQLGKQYPQGWVNTPGDKCIHGTYVGNRGGRDYLCGKCEDGI
ncbi:MAG: hypothetical protein DRH93_03370 [Deltaproteobacteria bacterium]|nr:MAG: hypothetical protein DRH93_03370 [Deltaproteobacteria bacterium]